MKKSHLSSPNIFSFALECSIFPLPSPNVDSGLIVAEYLQKQMKASRVESNQNTERIEATLSPLADKRLATAERMNRIKTRVTQDSCEPRHKTLLLFEGAGHLVAGLSCWEGVKTTVCRFGSQETLPGTGSSVPRFATRENSVEEIELKSGPPSICPQKCVSFSSVELKLQKIFALVDTSSQLGGGSVLLTKQAMSLALDPLEIAITTDGFCMLYSRSVC